MGSDSEETSGGSERVLTPGTHSGLDDLRSQIFSSAERSLHITIPDYMKNLLTVAGFESSALIATMDENTIEEVEVFAKKELQNIVSAKDIVKYYGFTYQNHPEKFKFVVGHKKILHMLIQFCKKQATKANEKNKILLKPNDNRCTVPNTVSEENCNKSSESSADLTTDFIEENKTVLKLVKTWLKSKVNPSRWLTLNFELDNAIFITRSSNKNELACQITCFCKSTYRVSKVSNRWVLSNFFRHLTAKHLDDESLIESETIKCKKNYFIP